MQGIARPALAMAAALILWLLGALAAGAHAEFRGSDPAADAVLDRLPASILLRFSEPVGVLALSWLLPGGAEAAAQAEAGGDGLTIAPPPEAGRGSYVLRWRVASVDGHPVGGALVFSVGEVSGAAVSGAAAEPAARAAVALRAGMVMALVLSVGAAVFQVTVAPLARAPVRIAARLAVLVPPLGLLWLGCEGLDRLGRPFAALAQPGVWAEAMHAPARFSVLLAALAAPLAIAALLRGSRAATLVAWALAALSFSVSGHALSAPSRLALPLTALHGAALLFWVGGLLPLAAALAPRDRPGRAALLRRFSRPALLAVFVLIATGTGLVLIRPLGAGTLETPWARLLGAKLALVAAMLALALWHRARALPRLEAGLDAPVRPSIRVEALLGLAVLCLAMAFRLAPPPSAALPDAPHVHLHGARAMADIALSAPPPGAISLRLTLADGDFAVLDPQEVRLSLTDPRASIGPLTVPATRQDAGLWVAGPVTLPSAGPWEIRLMLLVSDFEQVTLSGELAAGRTDAP